MSEKSGNVRKKKRWGKVFEYTPIRRDIVISDETTSEIEKELKNLKPTTPESFASKHAIKVSLAKQILNDKVEEGKLRKAHKGAKTAIYMT
jgi:ribosomal protein S25